mmetsp:Transcript_56813/g.164561  ORF Transcript_56813/g.164561 Transcript_56813/m.164561 type:complete len:234 (-) Transcript_56813:119-820(-)
MPVSVHKPLNGFRIVHVGIVVGEELVMGKEHFHPGNLHLIPRRYWRRCRIGEHDVFEASRSRFERSAAHPLVKHADDAKAISLLESLGRCNVGQLDGWRPCLFRNPSGDALHGAAASVLLLAPVDEQPDRGIPSYALLLRQLVLRGGIHLRQRNRRVGLLQLLGCSDELGHELLAMAAPRRIEEHEDESVASDRGLEGFVIQHQNAVLFRDFHTMDDKGDRRPKRGGPSELSC